MDNLTNESKLELIVMKTACNYFTLAAARRYSPEFEKSLLRLVAAITKQLPRLERITVRVSRDPENSDETFVVEVVAPAGTDLSYVRRAVDCIFDDERLDTLMFPTVIPSCWTL